MEYKEYLKTAHWLKTKKRILSKHPKCQVCGSQIKLNVHHNKYSLFNETEDDLIVLCRNCHSLYHDKLKVNTEHIPGKFWPVVKLDNGRVILKPEQLGIKT